jgi:phosphonoacetaldehyde hydrolase
MKKILLTPGPLNCSMRVKRKMLFDYGSRDIKFNDLVSNLRNKLLNLTTNNHNKYTSILLPGSGTYMVESVISSTINNNNNLGLLINGSYGKRMLQIANKHKINVNSLTLPENEAFELKHIDYFLNKHKEISHIGIIHCETTTGILNNIYEIGKYLKNKNKVFIVDAMSSFGGIPIDIETNNIDYLISSSNKCLHGPPGISYCIANKNHLSNCENISKTLSLDLFDQWKNFEINNQFRFTPPTHILSAFDEAINELNDSGGIIERNKQYTLFNNLLSNELELLGFEKYLTSNHSNIITTWKYPTNDFDFNSFYNYLSNNNILIYPGKLFNEKVFRIGNIGELTFDDLHYVINTIKNY